MRAPLTWLAENVELPAGTTAEEVAAALVRVGLEEEAIHGGDVQGPLTVGRVLEFVEEPQKNGKTIRWCRVDVGEDAPRGIVCGAHNFIVGDLIVASLPGAVLPGGFAIAARKTYGHVSDGMICSSRELGLGDDHDGIIRLGELGLDAAPGDDAIALFGLGEKTVEVNVTPDRGYAFSVRGVSRELAHATGGRFTDPADVEVPAATADGFAVRLADDAPIHGVAGCDRYVARIVRGVDPTAPSPRWLARRLEQVGMRSISLAVDVTNYVMLAVGQPLHAFDLAKLQGEIVVRRARAGETLTTLDDVERRLDPEDLLITDAGGERVLALAGVMGGADTEIDATTRDVLVEAAHFDAVTTARTARRHKLVTEAGRRYERGVDRDLAPAAAELAVRLLVEHGGGTAGPVTDVDERAAVAPIAFDPTLAARLVGVDYARDDVLAVLHEIGCTVDDSGDVLLVTPPGWRPDLRQGVDLVEEVARLRGYDAIPSVLPTAPPGRGLTHGQRVRRSVARSLAEHGLVEVISYPFVAPSLHDAFGEPADDPRRRALTVANPLSDEAPELRTSILGPLLEALRRNVSRGTSDVALFELGLVVHPDTAHSAPLPAGGVKPDEATLKALFAAVPHQPRMVGVVAAGARTTAGWTGPARPVDWADAVEAAQLVARTVGVEVTVTAADVAPWHPGRCARLEAAGGRTVGFAGELHPRVVAALGLPARTVAAEVNLDILTELSGGVRAARPLSAYPVAKEDVALIVDAAVSHAAVRDALVRGGGDLLESVHLFDVFTGAQVGDGKKSLAFALRLRAPGRTLTADEVTRARQAAVAEAARAVGAELRGAK